MPRINIYEVDETSGGSQNISTDVVYIPGFVADPTKAQNAPVLCRTLTEFETLFGNVPFRFSADVTEDFGDNEDVVVAKKDDCDKSYLMARELLNRGFMVMYDTIQDGAASLAYFYANIANRIDELKDKGEYTIKFITTGGYPAFEYDSNSIVDKMLEVCVTRGDAVAVIDHCNLPDRALTGTGSAYEAVCDYIEGMQQDTSKAKYPEFGAVFTPWATYALNVPDSWYPTDESTGKSINEFALPASFAYFNSMAESNKTNPDWLAIAGVTRGLVPQIKRLLTTERLSNTIANSYQPKGDEGGDVAVAINAITNIRPYGLTIWGNRTLKNNALKNGLTATSFLNTRNMVSDVKKVCYTTAKALMFEQNSNILWLSFKAGIIPLLDQLKSGNGISGYKILQQPTTEKAKLAAIIKLYPVYAVEEFDITIVLSDEDVTVA